MMTINFTIADAKLSRVKDGLLEVYPNTEVDENGDPKYTDNAWLKERIRRFVVDSVKRGEQIASQKSAKDALTETDTLIS